MTHDEAIEFIQDHDDNDEFSDDLLVELFLAIYDRMPDDQDVSEGLWSHLCAATE